MLYKIDFTTALSRALFSQVYDRLRKFALECGDTLDFFKMRMSQLQLGDPSIHLLVDLVEQDIVAHCLFQLSTMYKELDIYQAAVEQLEIDSGKNEGFVEACFEYAKQFNIGKIVMLSNENKFRAYKKKYDFRVLKVIMEKRLEVD